MGSREEQLAAERAHNVEESEKNRKESLKKEYSYVPADKFVDPNKTGWLTKRGGIHKTWKSRYFVLDGTTLFYYKNSTSVSPQGVIDLEGCEMFKDITRGKDHCFQISHTKRRSFYLYAKNADEMREWMTEMNKLITHSPSS